MKILNLILVCLFSTLLLISCENPSQKNYRIDAMTASQIKDLSISDKTVTVLLRVATPNPCYYYYHHTVLIEGDDAYIKVFGKDESEACVAVVGSFEVSMDVTFESSGEKRLNFWRQWENQYADTIVIIP